MQLLDFTVPIRWSGGQGVGLLVISASLLLVFFDFR